MTVWATLAFAAALLSAAERVIHRWNLARHGDPLDYTRVFQTTCAVLAAPAAVASAASAGGLPGQIGTVSLLIFGAAVCWTAFSLLTFYSDSLLEASVKSGISRLRIVWSLAIGVFVFAEDLTAQKLIGAALVAGAPLWLVHRSRYLSRRGIAYEVGATLALAGALAFDKAALRYLDATIVTFLSFANAAVMTTLLHGWRGRRDGGWTSAPSRLALVSGAAILSVACYYLLMTALSGGEISRVVPIYMLAPVLSTVLGIVLLGERTQVGLRLSVAAVATLGGALVAI